MTESKATLREVADGAYAYLQVGGWGFSNAGLITSNGASLLVDTLYDLDLTAEMLRAMRRVAPAAEQLDSVVNTHANGDHCWGNQLVGSANIISSRAAAEEMLELTPQLMSTLVKVSRAIEKLGPLATAPLRLLGRLGVSRASALAEAAPFIVESFGPFDFGRVSLRRPNTTFDKRLVLQVGNKEVQLIEVGPAHTKGDVIVYVPQDRVVFTGDILFVGSHPIVWDGPIDNWIAACDVILGLDVDVVVPGHGPLTDKQGVLDTKAYWLRLQDATADTPADDPLDPQAAERIASGLRGNQGLREAERLVINVDTALRELVRDRSRRDPLAMLARMARHKVG